MKQGHVRGRTRRAGTKAMQSRPARGGRASRRRKAPQPPRSGGWEVVPTRAPGGWWSAAGAAAARDAGRKARARPRAVSLREKGCEAVCPALFMEQASTISTRPNTISVRPGLTGLEHGQTAGSAPQGPGVTRTGTVERCRPPTGRPVRSDRERTLFFPGHYVPSGLRSITGRTI